MNGFHVPEGDFGRALLATYQPYLLVKREAIEQKNIADLIDVLKSATFRSLVGSIPGYDATGAGAVKTIGDAA